MKKCFSLIELIFVISIVAVIALVAVPKFSTAMDKTNIMKLKADVAFIRESIIAYKNKMILSNETVALDDLDSDDGRLFGKILNYNIESCDTPKGGAWQKTSQNSYTAYIDNDTAVVFKYDKDNFTFDCDFNDEYCEELMQ